MTPFEQDIAAQADALRALAHADIPAVPDLAGYDRIVLTGMGSSHAAALPTWRRLISRGLPAWWLDTGQLLDAPELVTGRTLLVVTSQSGASAEIVALLQRARPGTLVAVTNDARSPLAAAGDLTVALHSGPEATVSTKSYLNSLGVLDRLAAGLLGQPAEDLLAAAKSLDDAGNPEAGNPVTLAYVGYGDDAATALYAGLITKEGAKVPAEGFVGGQFRHGPFELAGPELTVVLFGGPDATHQRSLTRLAEDLIRAGSPVLGVGVTELPAEAIRVQVPAAGTVARLAHGAVIAQRLTVAIGYARGITPGAFRHGSKITTAL